MLEANDGRAVPLVSPSRVFLLRGQQSSPSDEDLSRLLDFFQIPWKTITAGGEDADLHEAKYAIVSSAHCMAEAMQIWAGSAASLPPWAAKASSVYVYGLQDSDRSKNLLRFLTGDVRANVRPIPAPQTIMTITGDLPGMCGPMSGMRVPITAPAGACVCDIRLGAEAYQSIIRSDGGELFFGVDTAGVRFFLNTCDKFIDVDSPSPKYFDVKKHFCETVPLLFFLRSMFHNVGSSLGETNACLIVDDPPLKHRYGFLDFREALDLMDRHNFTTTIAFIPWNWRRTHSHTVSLFQSRPERLSLVVHGCDHTAAEFAVRSPALLNRKIRTARQRMDWFHRTTAVEFEPVMVFPQGAFSPETGRALKLNGFVASVNTEVAPANGATNETKVADLWNVAIMKYGTFPIFTRRYLEHGIENFAFDALLGKPCLIVAHHDAFRDHARNLVDFIERLKSLSWNLVWRPLGDVILRSFRKRSFDDGTSAIQMFATSLVVENPSAEAGRVLVTKEEGDPECVQGVWVNQRPVEFSIQDEYLQSWLTVPPKETATIRVAYQNDLEVVPERSSSGVNFKVATKRYLSEFRDNYLSRSDLLYQSAYRLKRLLQ
jgi:hypothetical protein